ncbi:MAG: CUB domain-containing protein, partial [Bacteroidota bacterium]
DNATSIGIEHEGYIDEGASWYTQEMYESSAKLVRDLAARHGIDPSLAFSGPATDGIRTLSNACYRIKGHQHFRDNNHIDPGPYWDWERYYNLINGPPEVQEISDSQGTIKVLNYEANERKAYLINPPGNSPVRLTFKQFDLEWDSRRKEPFDFLDIYDGADAKGRPLGRFTGPEAPRGLVANSGKVFLEFRSDCRTSGKGFDLNFSTENVDINCRPMVSARVQSTFALGATVGWTASGSGQYVVKVRRRGSTSAWSQFQTRETSFQLTGLAANTPYEWAVHSVCDNDNISAPVGGNFTTRSVSRAGSPKVYVVNSPEGKFLDSGGELNSYANNEAYIYSIRPKGAGPIQVTFSEFNTEEDFDFLSVYDGPSPEDRLIGNFSGTNIPATLSSTGNSLTFRFVSDNRTQNSGWKASWKQQVPSGPSPEDPDGPDVVILPDNSKLSPTLKFPNRRPESSALMDPSYSASPIKVNFKDEASTGRAPAFRFYSVVQQEGSEWAAQPQRGFLWENFTQTLDENWEVVNGQWLVQNDQLVQADLQDGNTNIWTELNQAKGETYLYHWLARMEGESNNRRMGLHFFVSDPNLKQRGNSYFVWFRDADAGGKAEIYRTTNDRFEVKAKKKFNFSPGVAYDFKVIFQQSKGRIEVYINNEFVVSWNDPRPFSSGKAISFRTGNTLCTFDDLRVYKARSSSVSLAVDQEGKGDIVPGRIGRGGLRFRVFSAITNSTTREKARWSAISMMESRYFPSSDNTPSEEDPEIPDSQSGISLRPYYSDDFIVNLSSTGYFMIPTFYDRKLWSSAPNLGYFFDEFSGNKFRDDWILGEGKWKLRGGRLSQEEAAASNTNVSTLVTQTGGFVYLYHWKARLMTTGENKRFGIHFFASDGTQVNRGDSYMIWFRNYDKEQDQVEVYKSFDDDLREPLAKSPFVINPNTWYDFKVYFDSGLGIVRVFLDDEQVLSWQDLSTPYAKGAYVSLRTGNSAVQFDNFRVYRQQASKEPNITVGNSNFDMIRFQPSAKDRKVSLYFLRLGENGKWESEIKVNTEIR